MDDACFLLTRDDGRAMTRHITRRLSRGRPEERRNVATVDDRLKEVTSSGAAGKSSVSVKVRERIEWREVCV